MKTAEEQLDIITTYEETGSLRATADLCGTTHKTVKRIVDKHRADDPADDGPRRVVRNYDGVRDLVIDRVDATRGKITAKRTVPEIGATVQRRVADYLQRMADVTPERVDVVVDEIGRPPLAGA